MGEGVNKMSSHLLYTFRLSTLAVLHTLDNRGFRLTATARFRLLSIRLNRDADHLPMQ